MFDTAVIFSTTTPPEKSLGSLEAMKIGGFVFIGGMLLERTGKDEWSVVDKASVKHDGESFYTITIDMSESKHGIEEVQELANSEEIYETCLITGLLEEMKRIKKEDTKDEQ